MEAVRSPDIVFSLAGHDKHKAFVVLEADEKFVLLADGKTRKLVKPKRKSLKHLCLGKEGNPELARALSCGKATDSAIRKELAKFCSEVGMTEEGTELVKR